jgi:hypothetical protein
VLIFWEKNLSKSHFHNQILVVYVLFGRMNVLGCRYTATRTFHRGIRQIWALNHDRIMSSAFRVHDDARTNALPLANVIARHKSDDKDLSYLFQPLPYKAKGANPDDVNVGAELTGQIKKGRHGGRAR